METGNLILALTLFATLGGGFLKMYRALVLNTEITKTTAASVSDLNSRVGRLEQFAARASVAMNRRGT